MKVLVSLWGVEQRVKADLLGELPAPREQAQNRIDLEVEENITVGQLMELLGIDSGWLAVIGGRRALIDERLSEGAEVAFLTPLAGG